MNEHLTNRQIALLVFGGIVGYGVIGLPKNIAEAVWYWWMDSVTYYNRYSSYCWIYVYIPWIRSQGKNNL